MYMDMDVDTAMDTGHAHGYWTWTLIWKQGINMGVDTWKKTTGNVRLVIREKSITTKYCLSKDRKGRC
jgi:hypothetical protein